MMQGKLRQNFLYGHMCITLYGSAKGSKIDTYFYSQKNFLAERISFFTKKISFTKNILFSEKNFVQEIFLLQ